MNRGRLAVHLLAGAAIIAGLIGLYLTVVH